MPFNEELNKVADAADAVTSKWKTWAIVALFVFVAVIVIVAAVKFFF